MEEDISNQQLRALKARAQLLEPMFKVGKAGLSEGFVKSVAEAFQHTDLIKVKFVEFKEEKKELGKALADKTASRVVMQVGHVVVLHRREAPKDRVEADRADGGMV